MTSSITNTGENTLSSRLKAILPDCDRVDALVGYFYFSGFQDLHNELKDKQIRILIGMDMDPKIIEAISANKSYNLDRYTVDPTSVSKTQSYENYFDSFSKVFNDTDLFDNEGSQKSFEIFLNKIQDGSLQIKKTLKPDHSKMYILHNKPNFTRGGISPGIVIEGSSNLSISGLKNQGEHNRILQESHYYHEDVQRFETAWNDPDNITIADLNTSDSFTKKIKQKIWLYSLPSPQMMYYKVLSEYFAINEIEDFKTPQDITVGKFLNLQYQKDAVKIGIDRINKFGGVIISDVVGLGKSIIASAIAHNLGKQTIIICPPHLEDQWRDYMSAFDFKGQVYSTGKMQHALDRHGDSDQLLVILDEAHKHRNEDTDNYKILHKICSANYVMALSATPFNNDPKDIYALIKLFSTPGQSTIKTVENLSTSFHELFKRYKKVRKNIRKNIKSDSDVEQEKIGRETQNIAHELRKMIEPLIIRRSRLDLDAIEVYQKDLERQKISFPKVNDPELLEYDLGKISDLYITTLDQISSDNPDSFIGARYKPASYIRPGSKFIDQLIKDDDSEDDQISAEEKKHRIAQGQANIAKFMRWLLVRRFESSMGSFKLSLKKMIHSSEEMLTWLLDRKEVPILKEGTLPEVNELEDMSDEEVDEILSTLEGRGLIRIPAEEIDPNYERDLRTDIDLLKEIDQKWTKNTYDPKYLFFKNKIETLLKENPKRKIVIFSEFSDTAEYVYQNLIKDSLKRVFKYSSEDASKANKDIIRNNFDAGIDAKKQVDDYDVIIATDAISEGYNLHRAGVIINYDIPYNPTKVIQRIGRINRINKKVFDELFIYNFFPSITGENETATKAISTLKMKLIHALLGDDTKSLTSEEELRSYYSDQFKKENERNEQLSWDAVHRNTWLNVKNDLTLMKKIKAVPHRSRIARSSHNNGVLAFARRGVSYIFAHGNSPENISIVSPQIALSLFKCADDNEKSKQTSINFDPIYQIAKTHLFKNNTQNKVIGKRKQEALEKIKILSNLYPTSKMICDDIIIAIKDYDALPTGTIRDIANLKIDKSDPEKAYLTIQKSIPESYLKSIFETAKRANSDDQLIVLSEELIKA